MRLKTNLHFHTGDDPHDKISYSFYEGIDAAERNGFEVIALTCHRKFVWKKEYEAYAARKNILLIPGIEQNIEKKHVVILNADQSAETLSTWNELTAWKMAHRESFVLAPHPYFYGNFSLKDNLEQNINLFDAIELSWFYSRFFNRNKMAEVVAKRYGKPFIATSDTHDLKFLDSSYAIVEAKAKTIPSIFESMRQNNFENFTFPYKMFEMAMYVLKREVKNRLG